MTIKMGKISYSKHKFPYFTVAILVALTPLKHKKCFKINKSELADKPGSVEGNHSSRPAIAHWLKQHTRSQARAAPYEILFGLAPGGVYLATHCCQRRGALLPHPFTLTDWLRITNRRSPLCCTCRRLAPPRHYLAPCPMEPGLSSPYQYTNAR